MKLMQFSPFAPRVTSACIRDLLIKVLEIGVGKFSVLMVLYSVFGFDRNILRFSVLGDFFVPFFGF